MLMELLGWVGSILVVTAYGLNSYQKIPSASVPFYLMNLAGGILLIVYSFHKDALPNMFINVVWVLIALPPLIKLLTRR
jgi:hypothetical protein